MNARLCVRPAHTGDTRVYIARGSIVLRYGHEHDPAGRGFGERMTWPGTPMGKMRALMYKDLLNGKRI